MIDSLLLHIPQPSVASLFGYAAAVLPVYWAAWVIYARFFHPLAKYPGPFWASVSRFWMVGQIRKAQSEKTQRKLHDQLGKIVRIAPNEVAISDPEAIKTIYGINSGFTKTDFYTTWRPAWCKYPDAFSNLDKKLHASRRKITNNLYSMSSIAQSEDSINACTAVLMDKMSTFAKTGDTLDIAAWSQMYAFDVIGQLFFSRMFGFLKAGHDHLGYIKALDLLLPILCAASVMPTYLRTPFLVGGALVQPRVLKALTSLTDIENAAAECITEREALLKKNGPEPTDILASLFGTMRDKGEKVDFGLTEVKVEVYVALFAGSDTTAAAVSSILYHLMKNREAYDSLIRDIDEATASGALSVPFIRYKEASSLKYLDACIKEGMRLHPSVGLTLPRHVPTGGREISGQWFPEGVRVGINAAVIHRDRSIFGADADEFVPERWFRPEAPNMERYMFQFGGGARTCIGKNISLCEMYKMLAQLLREYRLDLVDPHRPWKTHNYWFNKPSEVYTRVTARAQVYG